jgi:hypothetical protein
MNAGTRLLVITGASTAGLTVHLHPVMRKPERAGLRVATGPRAFITLDVAPATIAASVGPDRRGRVARREDGPPLVSSRVRAD